MIDDASTRRVCRVLDVSRSSVRHETEVEGGHRTRSRSTPNPSLVEAVRDLIERFPTFGYRRLWAMLKRAGWTIAKKTVQRVLKIKGWQVHQRQAGRRPRVQASKSRASSSNERWAMDVTHVYCGEDGWGHLVAVIDCCDREVIGWEFALRGRAREAQRALEDACLDRFGSLFAPKTGPLLRSDNGLIFLSREFRGACSTYGLRQEYITPYTPEQNGLIERFFKSLKEECVWLHNFKDFTEANAAITRWIQFYNEERPHQSLDYLSPIEFRAKAA